MNCRFCSSSKLEPVLSLGRQPLANALLAELPGPGEREPVYPLDVVFCPACGLVQLTEIVPPEKLFGKYLYFSSTSQTMLDHVRASAQNLIPALKLGPKSLVVEAASNDGYMLQYFKQDGIPVLGIEPAENIAAEANRRGIPTRKMFFGTAAAELLKAEGLQADLFLANNVLAHVPDLNGFVEGIAVILKPAGTAVIEVPHVMELIRHTEFDTIYHEHMSYFSLITLQKVFAAHGLKIIHVERMPIHGGSLRVYAARKGRVSKAVTALIAEELKAGLDRIDAYREFAGKVERLKADLVEMLTGLKAKKKRVAGYGAAAKGAVLMNYCGLTASRVEYVVDANPHKQNRFMPGTHQRVYAPAKLLDDKPDYVLIFPWNIKDEIISQQSAYRKAGGKFIIPVPEPVMHF